MRTNVNSIFNMVRGGSPYTAINLILQYKENLWIVTCKMQYDHTLSAKICHMVDARLNISIKVTQKAKKINRLPCSWSTLKTEGDVKWGGWQYELATVKQPFYRIFYFYLFFYFFFFFVLLLLYPDFKQSRRPLTMKNNMTSRSPWTLKIKIYCLYTNLYTVLLISLKWKANGLLRKLSIITFPISLSRSSLS